MQRQTQICTYGKELQPNTASQEVYLCIAYLSWNAKISYVCGLTQSRFVSLNVV